MELIVRFLVGGLVVSIFAVLGDALKPKSFAGLFGAAPSVALATIGMALLKEGKSYAATEARSMVLGAASFFIYTLLVGRLLRQGKHAVLPTTAFLLAVWLGSALGFWYLILR